MGHVARLLSAQLRLLSHLRRVTQCPYSWEVLQVLSVNDLPPPHASRLHGDLQPAQHLQQQHQLQPFQGFAAHYAKGKAKGGKGGRGKAAAAIEEPQDAAQDAAADEPDYIHGPYQELMQQAVDHYLHELAGIRTGQANPGLIENLLVDAHGDHLPIKACGTVTVRNPQLLAVTLFDPSFAQPVEKAIKTSPLSLNPTSEGAEVLVKLPRMTQVTIEKMVKLVNMEAEQAKQSIRNARQKAMDAIKKAFKSGSADDKKRTEKELQRLHDEYVAEVDRLKRVKDTELRQHN